MTSALDPVTRGRLARDIENLTGEFTGVFSLETIERYLAESLDQFADAPTQGLVPVVVHRFTRERVQALAQAEGITAKDVPEVLFVRVRNAGRSQMAAALLDRHTLTRAANVIVTMGGGDACPVYPGKRYSDWDLDDPDGKTLDQVRPIRNEIERRVQALLAELALTP